MASATGRKKPKPIVTVTTGNVKTGQYQSRTETPMPEDEKSDKAKRAEYRQQFLDKLGVYKRFLDQYPELDALIKSAMKDYAQGDKWDMSRFLAVYNNTKFAQERSKAEEEYDLKVLGPNADVAKKSLEDETTKVKQDALRLGIQLSDAEAAEMAKQNVRSGLSEQEKSARWAARYGKMATASGKADVLAGAGPSGTVGSVQESLKDTARKYGLTMDNTLLQRLTSEALGQGERWNEYVSSQEGYFKEQAKLLYPNASGLLDTMTVDQIAEPYLQTAAAVLGKSPTEMDIRDPKWAAFMFGDGKILSKDEWVRVLRTDSQYGWDKSDQARGEFSRLGDELLSAFGMA